MGNLTCTATEACVSSTIAEVLDRLDSRINIYNSLSAELLARLNTVCAQSTNKSAAAGVSPKRTYDVPLAQALAEKVDQLESLNDRLGSILSSLDLR